jgi:hypothetical protein
MLLVLFWLMFSVLIKKGKTTEERFLSPFLRRRPLLFSNDRWEWQECGSS